MCPHFGLMNESQMSRQEVALQRAKLHWRGGKRRIIENKASLGISTVYDALLSAMRWYLLTNHLDELGDGAGEKLEDDQFVISLIRQVGVLDSSVDLGFLEKVFCQALQGEDPGTQQERFMLQARSLLTKLQVLPFDENELPPEDPSTY